MTLTVDANLLDYKTRTEAYFSSPLGVSGFRARPQGVGRLQNNLLDGGHALDVAAVHLLLVAPVLQRLELLPGAAAATLRVLESPLDPVEVHTQARPGRLPGRPALGPPM